jgi:hypothetical protein
MRGGVSHDRAAISANVNPRTLRRWLRQGEGDDDAGKNTDHSRFARDFRKAESDALGQVEMNVWQQSQEDWRAGAWLLSKKDPQRYGKEPDERAALQQQVVSEFIDFIESHVSRATFDEVLNALAGYGDTELDPKALPCPG